MPCFDENDPKAVATSVISVCSSRLDDGYDVTSTAPPTLNEAMAVITDGTETEAVV